MPRKAYKEKKPYLTKRTYSKKQGGGYRPNWYIAYQDGRTKYVPTRTADRAQAERLLAEFKAGLEAPVSGNEITVAGAVEKYLRYKKVRYEQMKANPVNFESLEFKLRRPLQFFGNLHVTQVARRLGAEYDAWRRKLLPTISNSTIRSEGTILNAVLNHAYKEGLVDKPYFIELPPSAPPRERRMSREEKQKLIAGCKTPHVKLFVLLAMTTAQRKSAILELKWSQVNLDSKLIEFNPPGRIRTNKRRVAVPINRLLYDALVAARKYARTEYVIEFNGKRVINIKKGFNAAAREAGLDGVTPHTCRHTAACDMAERGVVMQEIAALLGDSIRTVETHYLKYSPEYLKGAVKALEVL